MSKFIPGPSITFWTEAPEDAPEVKGYICYFKPERLEWRVWGYRGDRRLMVDVVAHGPATRVKYRQGAMRWGIQGMTESDTRPPWLLLPVDKLAHAILTVERLTQGGDDE